MGNVVNKAEKWPWFLKFLPCHSFNCFLHKWPKSWLLYWTRKEMKSKDRTMTKKMNKTDFNCSPSWVANTRKQGKYFFFYDLIWAIFKVEDFLINVTYKKKFHLCKYHYMPSKWSLEEPEQMLFCTSWGIYWGDGTPQVFLVVRKESSHMIPLKKHTNTHHREAYKMFPH